MTRRNWKRKWLTFIACMLMGFSCMFSIESSHITHLLWEHLMETLVDQFSGLLNIKTMSFIVRIIQSTNISDWCVSGSVLQCIYSRVYLFDNPCCPMRHTLEKCRCICITKQYRQLTMHWHTLWRNPASSEAFSFWVCTWSCIEILIIRRFQVHSILTAESILLWLWGLVSGGL